MIEKRFRFAPSPTGFLHIGSLRSVLFNYVSAKTSGGKLILRIEDTDLKRTVPGAIEKLVEILDWTGIKFDEGPHIGGAYGPYIQTQRLENYNKLIRELIEKDGAYYCFCTPERLEEMRQKQQAEKLPPRYDRHCRNLSKEEVESRIKNGEKYVIRQKLPTNGEIIVHDELRGDIKYLIAELDDHVLIKSNSIPTYQFANIVDDHLMEITHVMRGEEWIPSFPKNILLYRSFGWEIPKFYHLPLSLNKTGGKLSKRQGDVAVEDYKKKGYLPEAFINFCILSGWHPKNDNEILNMEDILKEFKIEDLGTSPTFFDIEKLDYFNGYYLRKKSVSELTSLCMPYLAENLEKTFKMHKKTDKFIGKVVALEQERLKVLSDIAESTRFFFTENLDYSFELLIWKKSNKENTLANLKKLYEILNTIGGEDWNTANLNLVLTKYFTENNLKVGDYLWPMRVALTGQAASPGPYEVADVLGKIESLERIAKAISIL